MPSATLAVRSVIDSRPPDRTWLGPVAPVRVPGQPPLDLGPAGPPARPVHLTQVTAGWLTAPRPGLPPAGRWAASLSVALVEVLQGRRAAAQLSRWVQEDVLARVALVERRRRASVPRSLAPPPVQVHSVRVQHPRADVAEVAAHLGLGRQRHAVALRLEGLGDRWLCTAAELGPGPWPL